MLYTEFHAGNKEYKLRLNTRNIVMLEKQLGCNPLAVFGNGDNIPTLTALVAILHASLQQYQHNIDMNSAYAIFDEYLADGNTLTDFIPVVIEVYKVSGLINQEENEKN